MANPNYFTSNYGTRINVTGLNKNQLNKVQTLANSRYGTRATNLANQWRSQIPKTTPQTGGGVTLGTGNQVATPPTNTTPPANTTGGLPNQIAGASTPPANTTTNTGNSSDITNTLFPTERIFEPQNYEGSPLYQWQVKTGQDQLAKSLAARGLTNSGKAIQDEVNIPLQAAANDTNRITSVAENNANRLANIQENEAQRKERMGNAQWDRQYSLAQLLAEQDPWNALTQGLGSYADTTTAAGKDYANYLAQAFQKVMGGGGGGASFTPSPLPTGPDYSNIDLAALNGNMNSSNNWLTLLGKGLGSLF